MAIKNRADFTCPPPVPMTFKNPDIKSGWLRWQFIDYCIRKNGWTTGAELGLWEGATISKLLEANKSLTMIGVDLWEAQPGNPGPEGYEGWDHGEHEKRCRDRCRPFGDRAIIYRDWTVAAASNVENESLDFVFIDADHSEQGARRDIEAWVPKLKPTGWIMGHDINWSGVRQAVDDLVSGYEIGPDVVWCRPVNPDATWPIWK